ncbi:hypothetical protein, partial [Streptococcus suis]|uniref:hypothetical protein n=1 Tax=Streptococcus suis TaxID=1307 RepID=UPI001EDCBE7E
AQKSRNRKKNTGSSAGFHQKQLNLSVFFIYWLVFAQPLLGKVVREEAISVGLWPWPEQAAYSRRTNHQFDWWF